MPGAALIFAQLGPLPEPLQRALPRTPKHPLPAILGGYTLTGVGLLPEDRVAALRFFKEGAATLVLLHQLFGPRGNTSLLDDQGRLLWAVQRPTHSLLSTLPPKATWATGASPENRPADDPLSTAAQDQLARQLALRLEQETGSTLKRLLGSARRLVLNLEKDLDSAEKGDEYRRRAEALATHLHEIQSGSGTVTLTDPRDGSELEIELNPGLSPSANLEAWFRRARKADKGREIIRARCEEASTQADLLTAASQKFEALPGPEATPVEQLAARQTWVAEHQDLMPARKSRGPGRKTEEPPRPFRRFLLDGRWEVWIGRNNKENDALTFGASHGKDIWLHAQGVPGSHVILRTGGKPEQVPRGIIEKAAALAALHCRSKHSALVPVIWTERRYVRKPRKSLPGAASCLREKSLFVTPELPAGAEGI